MTVIRFLLLLCSLISYKSACQGFATNSRLIRESSQRIFNAPSFLPVQNRHVALMGKKEARAEGNERKSKTERVRKVKDDVIEVEGVVLDSLPNAMFRCTIDGAPETQEPILATISGKIRKNFVKILVGDKVLIELSPYDLTRGRITFRYR